MNFKNISYKVLLFISILKLIKLSYYVLVHPLNFAFELFSEV